MQSGSIPLEVHWNLPWEKKIRLDETSDAFFLFLSRQHVSSSVEFLFTLLQTISIIFFNKRGKFCSEFFCCWCGRPVPTIITAESSSSTCRFMALPSNWNSQCHQFSVSSQPSWPPCSRWADHWQEIQFSSWPSAAGKVHNIHARMRYEATLKFCLYDWTCEVTKYESKFSSCGR